MNSRTRNNVTITGVDDAPVLLLAHGFGCDQNLWRPVVERLKNDFTLVLRSCRLWGIRSRCLGSRQILVVERLCR